MLYQSSIVSSVYSRSIFAIIIAAGLSALLFACSDEEKQIPPPEIFMPSDSGEIEASIGDTIILEPQITYNIKASYEWRKGAVRLDHSEQVLEDTATSLGRMEYFFGVTTPYGSDSITIPVDVIILSDFQNLQLEEKKDTFWIGANTTDGFMHKEMFFPNHYTNDNVWYGFGYSNIHKASTSLPAPPYSAYDKGGNQNIFGLFHQPYQTENQSFIQFRNEQSHQLKSIEITNSTLGYYLLKIGNDNFERMGGSSSSDPDWYKVTITGLNATGGVTGELEFFLADFRFDNNKKDYIIKQWTEVDLSELGAVNKVQFKLSSSRKDNEGNMVTPGYFCIDNLKILD